MEGNGDVVDDQQGVFMTQVCNMVDLQFKLHYLQRRGYWSGRKYVLGPAGSTYLGIGTGNTRASRTSPGPYIP